MYEYGTLAYSTRFVNEYAMNTVERCTKKRVSAAPQNPWICFLEKLCKNGRAPMLIGTRDLAVLLYTGYIPLTLIQHTNVRTTAPGTGILSVSLSLSLFAPLS